MHAVIQRLHASTPGQFYLIQSPKRTASSPWLPAWMYAMNFNTIASWSVSVQTPPRRPTSRHLPDRHSLSTFRSYTYGDVVHYLVHRIDLFRPSLHRDDSAPPTPSPRGKWMRHSLSSHRGSIDIVKTVVVLTDFQIGTLTTFLCHCIQNFPTQNSAPQAWNRGSETWPSRGAVSLRLMARANAGHQRKSTRVEGVGSVESPSFHVHLIQ